MIKKIIMYSTYIILIFFIIVLRYDNIKVKRLLSIKQKQKGKLELELKRVETELSGKYLMNKELNLGIDLRNFIGFDSSVLNKKYFIILYISQISCGTCVTEIINEWRLIIENNNNLSKNQLLIIRNI